LGTEVVSDRVTSKNENRLRESAQKPEIYIPIANAVAILDPRRVRKHLLRSIIRPDEGKSFFIPTRSHTTAAVSGTSGTSGICSPRHTVPQPNGPRPKGKGKRSTQQHNAHKNSKQVNSRMGPASGVAPASGRNVRADAKPLRNVEN
jgi:hypothetical protein